MPVDTSIYSQLRPVQIDSPFEMQAKAQNIRDMQHRNKLTELMFAEKELESSKRNALESLYRNAVDPATGKIDRTKLISGAAQGGLGAQIPGMQEQFSKQDKASAEADSKKFELATKRHDYYKKTLGALAQEPGLNKDLVLQAGQSLVAQGILPAEMYQQAIQNLPDDPEQLRQRLIQGVKAQMTPEQMFTVFAPKPEKLDNGQQISYRDMNPNSPTYGQATGGDPVQKMQSPESAASVAATIRGQNMTDARARETTAAGKAPPGYRYKQDGTLEAIPGGPADIKAGEAGAKAKGRAEHAVGQANVVIGTIDDALDKVGFFTTGFTGSALGKLPGTPAYNLRSTVDTVKANIGFDALQKMRDMSPTGGALGQVAVQELNMLQATLGNLDANQSEPEVRKKLQQVRKHYENWKGVMEKSAGLEASGGANPDQPGAKPPSPKPGAVMDGYRFKGGNPADPKSWEKV
jgi:hypothetical protein